MAPWCLSPLGREAALARLAQDSKRTATGCLEWTTAIDGRGYGAVWFIDRVHKVHRLACEATHGPAPAELPNALHHCDNPPCVDGSHLYWGTQAHNVRDMMERDRQPQKLRVGGTCQSGRHYLATQADIYTYPDGRHQKCIRCLYGRG